MSLYKAIDDLRAKTLRRFWDSVLVDRTSGCWLWAGKATPAGYGMISIGRKTTMAHRLSWELFKGEIPQKHMVCHDCPTGDNPRCVNPDHLFTAVQRDNILDMIRKGRWAGGGPSGERAGRAKMSDAQVAKARADYASNVTLTVSGLARSHGVSTHTMRAAILGVTWRHLPGATAIRFERKHLSDAEVAAIRLRAAAGERLTDLSKEYGSSLTHTSRLIRGKSRTSTR